MTLSASRRIIDAFTNMLRRTGLSFLIVGLLARPAHATLTTGENAIDVIGQYSSLDDSTPDYTKSCINDGASQIGFSWTATGADGGIAMDATHHYLFVADYDNSRVLVFTLNGSNQISSKTPSYVLGQTDLVSCGGNTSQSTMQHPGFVAVDPTNQRLFVGDTGNNRVLVFSTSSMSNGMNSAYVLGQTGFTTGGAATSQTTLSSPGGLAYDSANTRLYVADWGNNRVIVYNVATGSIANGENASFVLGQSGYTTKTSGTTQATLSGPNSVAYDSANSRLYIADQTNNRIMVLSTSSLSNGENASYVLGQTSYTANSANTTQAGLNLPSDLAFDATNSRLFVADSGNNRVEVFSTSSIASGENASNVLGQTSYTANGSGVTQSTMNEPIGVSYDSTNNDVYVSDHNSRILIFSAAGCSAGTTTYSTSGTQSYTVPTGCTGVTLDAYGAGGGGGQDVEGGGGGGGSVVQRHSDSSLLVAAGGGGGSGGNGSSQKGGGGGYARDIVSVGMLTPGETLDVWIGGGGIGNTGGDPGGNGGAVSGGAGGNTGSGGNSTYGGGGGVGVSGGTGGSSTYGGGGGGSNKGGVSGGSTYGGAGGKGVSCGTSTNGGACSSYSGGGGGGYGNTTVTNGTAGGAAANSGPGTGGSSGGNGGNGKVVITPTTSGVSNGENASDLLGQYSSLTSTSTVTYTQSAANNGLIKLGFNSPWGGIALDPAHHRLFVGDQNNNRVLVYNLNADNSFPSGSGGKTPAYVLGQADLLSNTQNNCTQSGFNLNDDLGMSFDTANSRLFVNDIGNGRILVFNVSTVSNNMNASYVLGQTNFTSCGQYAPGQNIFSNNIDSTYDATNSRLFVADFNNNRVLVFNVAPGTIANGENASYVLGQPDFTSGSAAATQSGMGSPDGLCYDSVNKRLFVSDYTYSRVLVYKADPPVIANGENASYVLGQPNFASSGGNITQNGVNGGGDCTIDAFNQRLFLSDGFRVLEYPISPSVIATGENASIVLGQTSFTTNNSGTTQGLLSQVGYLFYDPGSGRLFTGDVNNNRILIFEGSNLGGSPNMWTPGYE